ncbi:hypothetical protein R3P38DRAFT_315746 [Favolaschia claudopus]|uniref:Fungal-type protein kinase domain-containing protein n=1 Tax=Favolaschia claudopus TaxID=2862362 RepID=A0AAW0CVS7_9AGAR
MTETVSGVLQVPLECFFDRILPTTAQWHARVENVLVDEGHIVTGHWRCNSPVAEREREYLSIVQKILHTGQRVASRTPTCRLVSAPVIANNTQQPLPPDAQFELTDNTKFPTVIPWRLQSMRAPPPALDFNEEQMIWSCQEVLSSDPCRRFSYGITIEYTALRVWFFSPSHELVSAPFNGITEIHDLIRIVLRLAFATAEQLGYDTTMSHVGGTESAHMIKLTLGDSIYITKQLLSDHGKDSLCGGATRVWEAYREDDHERTSVAIKDVWMSADAIPEGSQLLELHEKLRTLSLPSLPHSLDHHFLTVIDHAFVPTSDGVNDDTLNLTRGELPNGFTERRRKHYRIVFKEVGTPIYKLQCVSEVMRALADATRGPCHFEPNVLLRCLSTVSALQLFYQLGLVHRDVSAGNILLVDGVGKLTDLEFMRSYRGPLPSSPADRYIGTANFTAGEVAAAWYAYPSKAHGAKHHSLDPPFRFNPFHDVESTLWIGIWVLFHHLHDVPEVKEFSQVHFPRRFTDMTAQCRTIAIRSGFLSLGESHPFHAVLEVLHDARFDLYRRYMLFESDFSNQYRFLEDETVLLGSSPFKDIHSIAIAHYEKAALCSEGLLLSEPRTDTSKRKATTNPPSPSDDVDVATPATPEPPAKKLKSMSPRGPPVTRFSAGSIKHGSSSTRPTRHSARLAEKKRSPTRNRAT